MSEEFTALRFGVIIFASCITVATVSHYAEWWALSYFLAIGFSLLGGIGVALEDKK